MLWQLQGSNTYVLGSIHATDMNPVQLLQEEEIAFSKATHVFFEIDYADSVDLAPTLLPPNAHLPEFITADTYTATRAHWTHLGLDEKSLLTIKPGWAALQLMGHAVQAAGYTPQLGVDAQLWNRAKCEAKRIGNLESRSEQIRILATAPIEEQVAFLAHVVALDAGLSEFREMLAAWKNRDAPFFERFLSARIALMPKTTSELIWRRNTNWIPTVLEKARQPEPTLFVVGALHLAGSIGLPNLLAQQGQKLLRQA
ncbi:TraB/GumN family protein [Paraburkholderia fungorum]|uniref:TraB/GumN family protein n=1 Tax=Paraburkholderia fungorum TaxID=134537 RepID=A0A420FKA3_9BURK|nr:TraB/GumN family protein [Paraburkholderia fungorum]RKF33379.1 hypothetical protein BCY88_09970 [Paraburkholderia fungorum]